MHPLKRRGVGGMGGAGGDPISRGNVSFWCSKLVHWVPYALLHPPAEGCAADSKRCASTAAHHHGAGAGAWFGSVLEPGVLIWGPFWMIWGPIWVSVSGLGVECCRQQLKT